MFQRQVETNDELVSMFLSNDFNFDILDKSSRVHTSDFGWAQFFRRSVYVEGGMENENFVAYAPEDKERFYGSPRWGIMSLESMTSFIIWSIQEDRTPGSIIT